MLHRIALLLLTILALASACTTPEPLGTARQRLDFECPPGCTCTCEGGAAGEAGTAGSSSGTGGDSGGSGGSSGSGGTAGDAGASGSAGTGGSGGGGFACDLSSYTTGTWRKLTTQPQPASSGSSRRHALGMSADPSNPGTLYSTWHAYNSTTGALLSGEGGVFKSTDCGVTWTEIGSFDAAHEVSVNPSNPSELYVANGVRGTLGFWYSSNAGSSWTQRTITDTTLTSGQNQTIMSNPNDVMRASPDPADWTHVVISSHYYGGTSGPSGLYESFDKGATWSGIFPGSTWGTGNFIQMLTGSTWFLGTQGSGYYRTTDGGDNWSQVYTYSASHGGFRLYQDSTGALYVGSGESGYIGRSTDGGASFSPLTGLGWGYWSAMGGVAGNLYTGRWNASNTTLRTATEASPNSWTSPVTGLNEAGTHMFVKDTVNGLLYVSMLSEGVWALKY